MSLLDNYPWLEQALRNHFPDQFIKQPVNFAYEVTPVRVFHYCRAKTPELCAKQAEVCSAVCLNDGGRYRAPYEHFIDMGDDARLPMSNRPGWSALDEAVTKGDVVIVSSLDRISRKATEVAEVQTAFATLGIKLIDASMSDWTDAWPTEDGLYWAYGKLCGRGKAKLHEVRVTGGIPYVLGHGSIHRSNGHELQFQRIKEPKLPCALVI